MTVPNVQLFNGCKMPILGLGTWGSPRGQVYQAVCDAIDIGYRHIDCAHVYQNEDEIGQALTEKIGNGDVNREELFVVSKLWNTFHRPDLVRGACETTLKNLQLKYLDMYLIHWPVGYQEGDQLFPETPEGRTAFSDVDYVDTWAEMEKLVDDGLVKSIGVSNFNKKQIDRILAVCKIPPAANQVECHPYLNQSKLMAYCTEKNIAITAYSPLGSPNRPWAKADDPLLLEDPRILEIATRVKKTAAQILIRYQIQRGNIVIPKSVTKSRIESNFDVFNFELTSEDMALIDSFNRDARFVPLTSAYGHPHHPFEHEVRKD